MHVHWYLVREVSRTNDLNKRWEKELNKKISPSPSPPLFVDWDELSNSECKRLSILYITPRNQSCFNLIVKITLVK